MSNLKKIAFLFALTTISLNTFSQKVTAKSTTTTTISNAVSEKRFLDSIASLKKQFLDLINHPPAIIFKNTAQSFTAKCVAPATGTDVKVTIPAGKYISAISQADANAAALDKATDSANQKLKCSSPTGIYYSVTKTYVANCPVGTTGTSSSYTVEARAFTSTISQVDADNKALQKATDSAKAGLTCTPIEVGSQAGRFYSTSQTYTATAPIGYEAQAVTFTYPDKAFISYISVADADTKAARAAKMLAEGTVMRYMEQSVPTIQDGNNASWGVGSIQKGSYDFIADFVRGKLSAGDNVGVETNSKYGSIGVGGAWPYKWFNTKAEMISNRTTDGRAVVANDYVGVIEDGGVYRYDAGNNSYALFTEVLKEYLSKINPHGLAATIKSITTLPDGKIKITLDKAAIVSENNVKVYFDNYALWQDKANKNATIQLPAGKFHSTYTFEPNRYVFVTFKGAGKDLTYVQSPKGFTSMSLQMEGIYDPTARPDHIASVSDLTVIGNSGADGFRFKEDEHFKDVPGYEYLAWINTRIESPSIYTQGIAMSSWYGTVKNCRVIDAIGYAIQSTVRGCVIDHCDIIQTQEVRTYMGWLLHNMGNEMDAKNVQGVVSNNTVTCAKLTHGIEGFRTGGTKELPVHFSNNTMVNSMMALNGTTNMLVENQTFDVTSTGLPESEWFNSGYAQITVNGLMGNSGDITFKNITMSGAPFIPNERYNWPMQIHGFTGGYGTPNLHIFDSKHVCGDADVEGNFAPHSFMIDANGGLIKNCKSFHKMSAWMLDYPEDFLEKSTMGLNYPSTMYDPTWNWKGGSIEDSEVNLEGGTIRTVKGTKVTNCKAALIVENGKYNGE